MLLFSGLEPDAAFKIKKSSNPKVITAQGAVIYGANPLRKREQDIFGNEPSRGDIDELEINTIAETYYGLKSEQKEEPEKNYSDFQEPGVTFESVMLNCIEFLETFFASKELIRGSEISLNIVDLGSYRSFFLNERGSSSNLKSGVLRNSYKSALDQKLMKNSVTDSPFFFAFNTSLIELSKHIANEAILAKNL